MRTRQWPLVFILTSLLIISSCEKENENETNISTYGSQKSHNMGQNCMNCHKSGGPGEGWFQAAGTVYDSTGNATYPNATVKLYSGPNGTGNLKYTIQADGKGNFYTTESIDFSGGLYPAVSGTQGTQYMGSSISMGQCNSCHGNTTNRIWTK
jgi:hypothetical protein